MNQDIEHKIINIIIELNENFERDELKNPTSDTTLYGASGVLDSIELVMLIAEVEAVMSEAYEKEVVLADEKAMSQRNSPFRTVRSLVEYIESLIGQPAE